MPIIVSVVYLMVGIIMFYIWPVIQIGIAGLGQLVLDSGYVGTWIYGIIERALIPFGLHHVFYMPFWQTELGGAALVDGVMVQGAQNIFFAELASKTTEQFSVSATRFMTGKFPFMIFGLPAAAYAMYKTARPEKKKVTYGLLLSAALTSMLTGITEPLEFTFLFVAPIMYAVHCVLAGLAYMLMHILNVGVGMTFSGGIIDLVLFGVLQGNTKTGWIWIVIIGLLYAIIYYVVFYYMIKKFNLKTPGREMDHEETKLYTRKDMKRPGSLNNVNENGEEDAVSAMIVNGLGGIDNLSDIDCCATRLRVTVLDSNLVFDRVLKESGASGVIHKGNGVQIIYGPQVSVIKSKLEDYIEGITSNKTDNIEQEQQSDSENGKTIHIYSCIKGKVIPLKEVSDEAFSSGMLGEGAAIEPSEGRLYAPCDGRIDMVFDTKHAITMVSEEGCELLLHIGIDTVRLEGKYYETYVANGQEVQRGDLLITFDMEKIKAAGYKITTPVIVCNTDVYSRVALVRTGEVTVGEDMINVM